MRKVCKRLAGRRRVGEIGLVLPLLLWDKRSIKGKRRTQHHVLWLTHVALHQRRRAELVNRPLQSCFLHLKLALCAGARARARERERERESVCVCVCVFGEGEERVREMMCVCVCACVPFSFSFSLPAPFFPPSSHCIQPQNIHRQCLRSQGLPG